MTENERPLTVEDLDKVLANPFYCMEIHPSMCEPHEPLVTADTWIKSAMKSIAEDADGGERFLLNLLDNLKGNFITN